MTDVLPAVTIDHWHHARYGDRWSVVNDDGRMILTFPSELEARRACRWYGWVVTGTDLGEIFHDEEGDR